MFRISVATAGIEDTHLLLLIFAAFDREAGQTQPRSNRTVEEIIMASKRVRRQASMYLSGQQAIEDLRMQFNPSQACLIPAHVTLCREDEVKDWSLFESRVLEIGCIGITIDFGMPIRDGNFVYLPAISVTDPFDDLRVKLLKNGTDVPRKQMPHITLIHPRNGCCTDVAFAAISRQIEPFSWTFREILMIEQIDGGPWSPFSTRCPMS